MDFFRNTRLHRLGVTLVILVGIAVAGWSSDAPAVRIGVVSQMGSERCSARWDPVLTYLDSAIGDHRFTMVPLNVDQALKTVEAGGLDFFIADPAVAAEMIYRKGGRKLATLKHRAPDGTPAVQCGGVVLCRRDSWSIEHAEDLRGLRFAAVNHRVLGGWLAAARELKKLGITRDQFATLEFLESDEAVVHAVFDGTVDAGTIETSALETMAAEGLIDLDELRIINLWDGDREASFPFRVSTRLYPERPFVAATHVPQDLVDRVAATLLSMPEDSELHPTSPCIAGWTLPAKYKPILDCLIELDVEPYGTLFRPSRHQLMMMYRWWIIGGVGLLLLIIGGSIAIVRKNRELGRFKSELQNELDRRKKSESELKASEKRYRMIVENAPDPFFSLDRDGLIDDVNEAFLHAILFRRDQILGTHHETGIHPEDRQLVAGAIADVSKGGTGRYEARVRDATGRHSWYSIVIWQKFDERGEPAGIQGLARNVDDRRKDEIRLRQLSQAIEQSPVAVVITDVEGTIQYVNPTCSEMTGYSSEELLGKNPRVLQSGRHPESFYRELWETILSGEIWRGEFWNRTRDGVEYLERATIAPVRDHHGEIVRFVAVKESYREIHEITRTLRETEALFQTVIETARDAIFVKDRDFRYRLVNPAMARSFDLTPEEIRGLTDLDLFDEETAREIRNNDRRVLEGEVVEAISSSTVHGKTRSFAVSRVPLKDQEGTIIGICGIARDITERLKYEERLEEARNEAETATRAKSLFLANISHELRTPLNGIVGMIDLLDQTTLNQEQREYLRIAETSANLLTELIGDVLDLSRIEAGKIRLNPETLILREWLKETIDIVIERAKAKDLHLTFAIEPDVPKTIRADHCRLQQILLNIVSNAIKFTEEGSIAVIVESDPTEGQPGKSLRFSVIDTGIGVPGDRLETIFGVFSQADESPTRRHGGSGLGLAISKELIEKMGGRIWAEQRTEGGTVFRFTLPQESIETVEVKRDGASEPPPLSSSADLHVLVVDDNPVNRIVAVEAVRRFGHRVVEAENGSEALDILISQGPFDVVFMDVQMPIMDGLEATRHIRRGQAGDPHIRIIGLTAAATATDAEACLRAGMDEYLSKPVRFEELRAALDRAQACRS